MVVNIDKFLEPSEVMGGGGGGFAVATVSWSPGIVQDISGPPALGTLPGSAINTQDHADAATSGLKFEFTVPENYDSGSLRLQAVYAMSTAIGSPNNVVVLNIGAEIADSVGGGIDTGSYAPGTVALTTPDASTNVARSGDLLTIMAGDFDIGDKVVFLIERLGADGADVHTGVWKLVDYMVLYEGQVAASAAIHQVEIFSDTGGTPAAPGTKASFDTLDFQEGFTHEQKFQWTIPDNWDGSSDFHVRLTYAMTTASANNVRLDFSGDVANVSTGGIDALTAKTFIISTPSDTLVHRTSVVYSVPAVDRNPGDAVVIEVGRPSGDPADTHTGNWQLIAAVVFIGQGGSLPVAAGTTITVEARTTSYTLVADDSGSLQTNRGAGAIVTATLPPTGALAIGTNYVFRRVAAFAFRVDPQPADNLSYSAGAMAAGEYLEMADIPATFRVIWDGVEWLVDHENGTLTEETP